MSADAHEISVATREEKAWYFLLLWAADPEMHEQRKRHGILEALDA